MYVGNEKLKPDMDLLAFLENAEQPLLIMSLKTSLRERAGQTMRWKLLLDVARECPTLREKYGLNYHGHGRIFFVLLTTNFYKEMFTSQQMANFRFFDSVYVARMLNKKELSILKEKSFVKRLSKIIDDINAFF
ncbi:hypothetical protein B9Q11_04320 [Candidatus Marsarchaeota G2 archaeon ECH_B_SAG-F08]|jgi:type II restriction enzyme|uniref:BsaWI restriction endonuclease type 2 domain-containing protein n=3 Tax=Candidatus Marsarchaeota TaxID=1978152 RepID=A0A2R6BFH5_9ARCH|nr:MAG: hypothetical protein B9Q11_04320 [Candidatus Marsarchaeota G2 archaeon ECH_B_SAG-F08]PSO04372.1 MAG: hypothetical protein B9Q13_04725 [Candidatus Marsarchaeota G2 archaeon ECH_B_SAG-G16]